MDQGQKHDLRLESKAEVKEKENSVAFCSPAKRLAFSGLLENPLVGKKLKS